MPSGQHYSGSNRIPNIKQFMESLDRDKKKRDAEIEAQNKKNNTTTPTPGSPTHQEHKSPTPKKASNQRTVRDPVTGRDVTIDDHNDDMYKAVEDPHVSRAQQPNLRFHLFAIKGVVANFI